MDDDRAGFAHWSQLVTHLEERYREVRAFPGDLLRFTFDSGDREVGVGVSHARPPSGRSWVSIAVKVGLVSRARAMTALRLNSVLPLGTLATIGEHVVVRQSLPVLGLRPAVFDQTLAKLVAVAAELGAETSAGPYARLFR